MRPVLLVRPDRNDADADALADVGIDTLVDPYLSVAAVGDPTAARDLLAAVHHAGEGCWLVVTSPRAWSAWAALVAPAGRTAPAPPGPAPAPGRFAPAPTREFGPSVSDPTHPACPSAPDRLTLAVEAARTAGLRVAAIGPATASSVTCGVDLIASTPSAAGLLADLLAVGGHAAILPGSAIARVDLARGLGAAGWAVTSGAVYDTVARTDRPASADLVEAGRVAAILLRSPSAARAVDRHVRVPSGLPVFAAGATTLAACPPGWTAIEVPTTPAAATASAIRKEI